jgi:exodeoxyribonuclease VII large subunit
MKQYSLSELCEYIRDTVESSLPERYWVCSEIASLSVRGHCYLELAEKAKNGIHAAKVRATCWSNVFNLLSPYFTEATGETLRVGMQVLLQVSIEFHPVYGLSLNVWNIDPTYTMGDLAKRRKETLQRLQEDGVMELQKTLRVPSLIRRIAVISSADAAGYQDFCDQLQHNRYGFAFYPHLFSATMQGETAARSIVQALNTIALQEEEWDVVVIIRGGGASTDLSCFDDYELASHCAQFPLPIITGIGHTKDISIVDMVAHTCVKTPTAAAEWLIEGITKEAERIQELWQRLEKAVQKSIRQEENRLLQYQLRLQKAMQHAVAKEKNRLEWWMKTIELHSPERIFRKGYSLTTVNGKVVRSKDEIKAGDILETHLINDIIHSEVK